MTARDANERIALGVAAAVVTIAVLAPMIRWRRAHATTASPPLPELHVPFASDAIERDGELEEKSWLSAARSGHFVAPDGKEATPYSDARFVWAKDALRVGLYAADEDIVAADAFHVTLRANGVEHVIDVGPKCVPSNPNHRRDAPDQMNVKVGCDADGTIDTPGDSDEEWVVEMEVPFAELGLQGAPGEQIEASVRRCDGKRCGEMPATRLILGD